MRVEVEAHPNAEVTRVELSEGRLREWVTAAPVEGRANDAIEQAIADAFGLRRGQVRIVRGVMSRHKMVELNTADLNGLRVRPKIFQTSTILNSVAGRIASRQRLVSSYLAHERS